MAGAAVMAGSPASAPAKEAGSPPDKKGTVPTNPFVVGAKEYTESFLDESVLMTSGSQQRNDRKVAAAGFLRGVWILITLSGGAAGGNNAVLRADAPWNVIESITLRDTNGQAIIGPVPGWQLYAINKYGGYKWDCEPLNSPEYTALTTSGNGVFSLYLPVEQSARDAFCALPNTSSAQPYHVDYTLSGSGTVFSTAPDTLPTVRVQMVGEFWAQPPAMDLYGRPNAQFPPELGTMANWTRQIVNVTAGDNKIELSRMGNLIRNLVFVYYDDTAVPVRTTSELPTRLRIELDNTTLYNEPLAYRHHIMRERYGFDPDTGVIVYDFAHDLDGHPGQEMRGQYLPTSGGSKLTIEGEWGGSGGKLHILTNDILPAAAGTLPGSAR